MGRAPHFHIAAYPMRCPAAASKTTRLAFARRAEGSTSTSESPSSVTLTRLPPSDSDCMGYISDQTTDIYGLIARSAPERETQLREFQRSYPVRILKADDRSGIVMNATSQCVKYASKDLEVVWLVGFSLWEAINLFAPAMLVPSQFGGTREAVMELDENLPRFEYDYRERLAAIARVIEAPSVDEGLWPPDIPWPVSSETICSQPSTRRSTIWCSWRWRSSFSTSCVM